MPLALPPAAMSSSTTAFAPASSISTTPTLAPSRAKRRAPARPMPDAAAVTMPTLPSSRTAGALPSVQVVQPGDVLAGDLAAHGGREGGEVLVEHLLRLGP